MLRHAVLALALLLPACPPADKTDAAPSPGASAAPCTKFGQTCEVSPGKLGTCVARDDCGGGPSPCFVCQSQH